MPKTFDIIQQYHARQSIIADKATEDITYTPKSGSPKSITCFVNRMPINPVSGGQTIYPDLEIWIVNDSTFGVTSVDVGGDSVTIKRRLDKTAEVIKISAVLQDSDNTNWHLRLG
ncbi:MAG: hypothetical protein ABIP54_03740 [Candidatus Andersenbacteria bacterium]